MKKINDYLNTKQAAKFLGIAENTLRGWGNRHKIKVYRNPQNDYRLYDKKDLEELLVKIQQA